MPRKQSPPNPELQKILMQHMQRVFYWSLVPFVMGCVLLLLNKPMGWFACIGAFLFCLREPLEYSRSKKSSVSRFREERHFLNGMFAGIFSQFAARMFDGSPVDRLGPDNRLWFLVVTATLLTIYSVLEGKLMRQTAALLDEPTG